jgi:hypothetical protein
MGDLGEGVGERIGGLGGCLIPSTTIILTLLLIIAALAT